MFYQVVPFKPYRSPHRISLIIILILKYVINISKCLLTHIAAAYQRNKGQFANSGDLWHCAEPGFARGCDERERETQSGFPC